uniref:Ectonucleoside triphosphate diphosphohydrolase 3 n=1 Tax=Sander lucioperca TaxID=283035 RepID=A0A8C9YYG4_SANLU
MASKQQIGYKCRIAGVLLLLLAKVLLDRPNIDFFLLLQYGIVIDSGSSRSNVYLYKWPGEKQNETGVVTEIMNCKVAGDGISEMKVDPQKDAKSWKGFKECMDNITKAIPTKKHETTPLFLGATAGMRLLHEKDEQRCNEILASLTAYLRSLPFNFHNASIITGQEEGLYGWVTVNYLMGNFLEVRHWKNTVGSMDLGGASTQIAFAVQDDLSGPDYLHVKLYGYPYNVYTHSFLCYGKNEAYKRVLDKVESSDPTYIINPCYPEGFNTTLKASYIYDTECTKKPNGYNPHQELFLVGTADPDKCGSIVKSIFDFKTCNSSQCSLNGVEQPPVTGDFMVTHSANRTCLHSIVSFFFLITGHSNLCFSSFQLSAKKAWIAERYLKTYCFAAHYVFTLLADGYKFDKETWKNINFEREAKNTSIGWSLGYMLSMSNMIPSEVKYTPPMTDPVFAGLVFLFSALTIITVVFVFIILIRTCY